MATLDDLIKADYAQTLQMTDSQLSMMSISDLKLLFQQVGSIARMTGTGRTFWVQAADPGASASNGDIWFDIT